jgi:hypothetical protein
MFLGLPDLDPLVRGSDPAPDPSVIKQNSKKTLDSYCFATSLWLFLAWKNDVNSKSNKHKKREKNLFFVGVLKVTDEKSRIRISYSELRFPKSGSVLKYHGSGTQLNTN